MSWTCIASLRCSAWLGGSSLSHLACSTSSGPCSSVSTPLSPAGSNYLAQEPECGAFVRWLFFSLAVLPSVVQSFSDAPTVTFGALLRRHLCFFFLSISLRQLWCFGMVSHLQHCELVCFACLPTRKHQWRGAAECKTMVLFSRSLNVYEPEHLWPRCCRGPLRWACASNSLC